MAVKITKAQLTSMRKTEAKPKGRPNQYAEYVAQIHADKDTAFGIDTFKEREEAMRKKNTVNTSLRNMNTKDVVAEVYDVLDKDGKTITGYQVVLQAK